MSQRCVRCHQRVRLEIMPDHDAVWASGERWDRWLCPDQRFHKVSHKRGVK